MKRKWADMTWMNATRYYLPIGPKECGGRGERCENKWDGKGVETGGIIYYPVRNSENRICYSS